MTFAKKSKINKNATHIDNPHLAASSSKHANAILKVQSPDQKVTISVTDFVQDSTHL